MNAIPLLQNNFPPPDDLLAIIQKGSIKTLGPVGPKYKVVRPIRCLPDQDWEIEINLVETGETTEYHYQHMRDDPEAV